MDTSALRPICLPSYHPKMSSLRHLPLLMGHQSSGEKLMTRGIDGDFSGPCGHLLEDLPHWLESCPRLDIKDEFRLVLDSQLKKSKVKIPTNEVLSKVNRLRRVLPPKFRAKVLQGIWPDNFNTNLRSKLRIKG